MILIMFLIVLLLIYFIVTLLLLESNEGADKKATILLWPVHLSIILFMSSAVFINLCIGEVLNKVNIPYSKTKLYEKIDSLI